MIIILSIFNMIFMGKVKVSLFVSFIILKQKFGDNHSVFIPYNGNSE